MAEPSKTSNDSPDTVDESQTADQVQERQYTEDETRAIQHGWTPKEKWEGPEDEWIPAKVFNMRGDLFGRIAKDKREISELRSTVNELVQQSRKTYDEGYKAGMTELKAARKQAIADGDAEKAFEIDEQIDDLREKHAAEKAQFEQKIQQSAQQAATQTNPVFEQWHTENGWYLQDRVTTNYANDLMIEMSEQARMNGVQVDYPKALREITQKVRQKFPEKFGKQVQVKDPVESGSSRSEPKPRNNSMSSVEKGMTDEETVIMKNIMKSTGMSKEDYLKEYHKFTERKR